jgi:hypothetical protein
LSQTSAEAKCRKCAAPGSHKLFDNRSDNAGSRSALRLSLLDERTSAFPKGVTGSDPVRGIQKDFLAARVRPAGIGRKPFRREHWPIGPSAPSRRGIGKMLVELGSILSRRRACVSGSRHRLKRTPMYFQRRSHIEVIRHQRLQVLSERPANASVQRKARANVRYVAQERIRRRTFKSVGQPPIYLACTASSLLQSPPRAGPCLSFWRSPMLFAYFPLYGLHACWTCTRRAFRCGN